MSANKTNRRSRRLIFNSRLCSLSVVIIHMKQSLKSSAWIIVPDRTTKKIFFQRSTRKYKIIATVITVLGVNCNFRLIAIQ